jgi:hypothetical protein
MTNNHFKLNFREGEPDLYLNMDQDRFRFTDPLLDLTFVEIRD